ncbi:MAG TPA: hypothetical protein VMH85_09390 [Terriglobales bacterium]|nr:hypothetical protein [Terriglobales bacterium]
MSVNVIRISLALLAGLLIVSQAAANDHDRFQMNHNLRVEAGEQAGDVTCLHCSIYIRGEVTGDVTAIGGSIHVEDSGVVRGDAAAILGDIRLTGKAQISGDAAAIAGEVERDRDTVVSGDVSSMEGTGWFVLVFLVPLAFVGGMIAGIVWLVRRSRRPARPAYGTVRA